jgi:hypothetical protein
MSTPAGVTPGGLIVAAEPAHASKLAAVVFDLGRSRAAEDCASLNGLSHFCRVTPADLD